MSNRNNHTFIALTALWAFVESGLGGMMHALHLPFTGVFLGGFSVLIISLMAHFEPKPYGSIIKATLIVMAVKFSVNPMTSPFAYIAVGFQGLCGALIYGSSIRHPALSMLFAIVAMLESAFQKLLIITLIFGDSWIKALDIYYKSVLKIFGTDTDSPFGLYLLGTYLMIYSVWGIFLGIWAWQIPAQLQRRMHLYMELDSRADAEHIRTTPKRKKKSWLLLLILLLTLLTFLMDSEQPGMASAVLIFRTFAVVTVWILLIMPLWKRLVQRQLEKRSQVEMPQVLAMIPLISAYTQPLMKAVGSQYGGLRKWKEFVLGLMVISLRQDQTP